MKKKKIFDTYPDSYPERLSARLIKCNSKTITLPALYIKLSITLIRATVSELQIQKFCIYDKEKNFTFCDIMRSSHKVHFSDQNMKCCTCVGL